MDFNQDYFQLLALERSFTLDRNRLVENYRNLQKETHPDRFAHLPAADQRRSLQYSTLVNEAYEVLSSSLKRAQYLLQLEGIELGDRTHHASPDFLMQQIELREELEELEEVDDPEAAIDQLAGKIRDLKKGLEEEFAAAYSDKQLAEAEEAVTRLQYFCRLEEELAALEQRLLDY